MFHENNEMNSKQQKELEYIQQVEETQPIKEEYQLNAQDINLINEITKNFISYHNLIVYGGYALNALLPSNDQFYGQDEFHDYDVLSPYAKQHARELADTYYRYGFRYTEVRPAVHDGTYKVFINWVHVADVTDVSKTFFKEMLKLSKQERLTHKYLKDTSPPLNIAPVTLLKQFIVAELARPQSSLYRWKKIYNRLLKIFKYYSSPARSPGSKSSDPHPTAKYSSKALTEQSIYEQSVHLQEMYSCILDFVKLNQLPIVGNLGVGIYLGKNIKTLTKFILECCRIDDTLSIFEILSNNPQDTMEMVHKHLSAIMPSGYKLSRKTRKFYNEILPKRHQLSVHFNNRHMNLLTVIDSRDHCYAVINKNGYCLGTPYTLLNFLYAYWLLYHIYESDAATTNIKTLIKAMEVYIHKQSTLKERFVTDCYGKEKALINVKKEHFLDKARDYIYKPALVS